MVLAVKIEEKREELKDEGKARPKTEPGKSRSAEQAAHCAIQLG